MKNGPYKSVVGAKIYLGMTTRLDLTWLQVPILWLNIISNQGIIVGHQWKGYSCIWRKLPLMDWFIIVVMEIWKLLAIEILIGEEMPRAANQGQSMYLFCPMQFFLGIASCKIL
jgi:hypothetical protein